MSLVSRLDVVVADASQLVIAAGMGPGGDPGQDSVDGGSRLAREPGHRAAEVQNPGDLQGVVLDGPLIDRARIGSRRHAHDQASPLGTLTSGNSSPWIGSWSVSCSFS